MAFDFPNAPSVGQSYTPAAGTPTYMWNGVSWDVIPASVSPGTLVEIRRQVVATPASVIAFTSGIDATYDEYELHWYNLRVSADGALALRVSWDGGATYKTSTAEYLDALAMAAITSPTFTSSTTLGYARLSPLIMASVTGVPAFGTARFFRPYDVSAVNIFQTNAFQYNPGGGYSNWAGITGHNGVGAMNAFQLWPSAGGNFNSGTFVLYGRSKTPVAAAVAPGSRVLIQSQTIGAAVASVDFTTGIDSLYDEYEVSFFNARAGTGGNNLVMVVSTDGGATWITSNSYTWQVTHFLSTVQTGLSSGGASQLNLTTWALFPTGANPLYSQAGKVTFYQPSVAGMHHNFIFDLGGHGNDAVPIRHIGAGTINLGGAGFNGLRFKMGAGNLATGTWNLYGIKK